MGYARRGGGADIGVTDGRRCPVGEHPGHDGYGTAVQEALRCRRRCAGRRESFGGRFLDVYKGFAALHDNALSPGALDTKTKALIAFAIVISECCDGCIAAHAHAAVRHEAEPQEAADAIGVAILMTGGPATIYGPRGFAAFQEFYAAAHPADAKTPSAVGAEG
jgi:AhpD family alkylhydroperoxidase